MAQKGWTTVVRGGRQKKSNDESVPAREVRPVHRYNWRLYHWTLKNDGRGDCWLLSLLQTYLIVNVGINSYRAQEALTKNGKSAAEIEKLEILVSLFRSVTVKTFENDTSHALRIGFDQPQAAFTDEEISEMALTESRDIRNATDWTNCILFPGGLGDDLAVHLLVTKVLNIPDFALVKPVVYHGDRVLWTTDNNSSPLHGKNMVMYHHGHYEVIVPKNVSAFFIRV